jgi:hypothetical protein
MFKYFLAQFLQKVHLYASIFPFFKEGLYFPHSGFI